MKHMPDGAFTRVAVWVTLCAAAAFLLPSVAQALS